MKHKKFQSGRLGFLLPGRRCMSATKWTIREWVYRLVIIGVLVGVAWGTFQLDRLGAFGRIRRQDIQTYNGKEFRVIHTVDGDTIDIDHVDAAALRTRIRLWGVDTPETVKPNRRVEHFGPEASDFTRKATMNKTVRLELLPHDTRDKYGRLLAYVYLPDGKMLNALLVEKGLAYADPRFSHPHMAEFKNKMRTAQKNKTGLWKTPVKADLPYYLRPKSR